MRELKFRAWDGNKIFSFDNHKYDLIYNDISGWNIAPNTPNYTGEWLTGESASSSKDFVLEQYTGLKDKNGVEIYEGDIVTFFKYDDKNLPMKGVVKYDKEIVSFFVCCDSDSFNLSGNYCFKKGRLYEVIGNIHQNPELLK